MFAGQARLSLVLDAQEYRKPRLQLISVHLRTNRYSQHRAYFCNMHFMLFFGICYEIIVWS